MNPDISTEIQLSISIMNATFFLVYTRQLFGSFRIVIKIENLQVVKFLLCYHVEDIQIKETLGSGVSWIFTCCYAIG